MTFYSDLQQVAKDVIGEFKQGAVKYIEPGTESGPAYNPTITPGTEHEIDATVRGVASKFVDGTTILSSDFQLVTPAGFGVVPVQAGTVEADGTTYTIVQIDPVPAAGTPVVYRIFLRR